MMKAHFFVGVSLFVLLIVDIYSLPLKKGLPQQSGSNTGGTNFASNMVAPLGRYPSASMLNAAPPSNVYMPVPDTGVSQPVYREPELAVGSGPSMPAQPGFATGGSLTSQSGLPASASMPGQAVADTSMPAQPGFVPGAPHPVAIQPEPQDIKWAVPPPLFTGGEDMSSHSLGLPGHSHDPGHAHIEESQFLPPLPPSRPMYQPGELSHFEKNAESGNYQSETEEMGHPPFSPPGPFPLPPDLVPPGPGGPHFGVGGLWGPLYPYFDYMFLTGQYPPGTVSHFSQNFEHGRDYYHDTHYTKEYAPEPNSDQQVNQIPESHGYVQEKQS